MNSTAGFTFSTVQLAAGPRLHYAEHGDPDGEPVLFLHGWPDSWFSFSRVVPLLPSRYRTLVPDHRGFGDSDRPPTGYAIEDLAQDSVALLDRLSIDRVAIVGHSFGSFVSRALALGHPERVTRIALIGTGLRATTPVILEAQQAIADLTDPVPESFARSFQSGTVYRPVPESFFDQIIAESMKLPARLWRETLDRLIAYDDVARLGRITSPTLLLWGDHDALFPRVDQDRLVTEISGARLRIYAETGHCPNWERPEDVAADLQSFLQPNP
jgi:pimeloyl-ACP methyl ester carboxylesterase